jgi:small subunit ribosomal protein S5
MALAKVGWFSNPEMELNMTDYIEFEPELDERVVEIARVAKVVKGGRRFSFRVTVVTGDNRGSVGVGSGKANAVPDAMRKASEHARRDMHKIAVLGTTIPHEVLGRVAGAQVLLKPASPGTGVIAGGGVRAVLEAAGISDILTKSLGSSNLLNVVYATMEALDQLKSPGEVAALRGKSQKDVSPFWERRKNG